ncbi:hypothetical protein GUJ93_ZPchr0010g11212 [Zizania palustris]|uniref:Uncharacterized protein n=1 Tax=Zizania palustris TaxID=103762 RepID=A0A8J5W7A8_ZIZPA|nr:hypothetical protein GUJ93_ZPchr0010g11212 [Zizania palustris]
MADGVEGNCMARVARCGRELRPWQVVWEETTTTWGSDRMRSSRAISMAQRGRGAAVACESEVTMYVEREGGTTTVKHREREGGGAKTAACKVVASSMHREAYPYKMTGYRGADGDKD